MLNIVKYRNIPFFISGVLILMSVFALVKFGLKPGIDFTGGSLLEVRFVQRPAVSEIQETLRELNIENAVVQPSGENNMLMRMRYLDESEHQVILSKLREKFSQKKEIEAGLEKSASENLVKLVREEELKTAKKQGAGNLNFDLPKDEVKLETDVVSAGSLETPDVLEVRFETIGAAVSANLRERSMYTAIAVIFATILYIAYSFRRVSKPVQSWKYGVAAIIAMLQNVLIVMGLFAVLSYYQSFEADIPFVVAIITIIGYSVNDTIVVFDRIRENVIRLGSDHFGTTVNKAINETLARSINTSLTTLLVLIALFLFGGESIRYFALALVIGIAISIYSSIFLTSPFLVEMEKWSKK